jgi:ligand-binding sensor domain-containing protein
MRTKILFIAFFLLMVIENGKAQSKGYSITNHRNGNQVHLVTTSDSSVFIGTSNGVYQRDYTGKITNVLNKEKGLLNDFAHLVFAEQED